MKIRWKQKQTQKYIEDNIVIKITDQDLFFNNINKYLNKSIDEFLNIKLITDENDDDDF